MDKEDINGIAKVIKIQVKIVKKEKLNGKYKCIKLSVLMWTANDLSYHFKLSREEKHQFLELCGLE